MNKLIPFIALGFGIAMAVIIGQKMTSDAMAVILGVAAIVPVMCVVHMVVMHMRV